jgi:hypothetical protein
MAPAAFVPTSSRRSATGAPGCGLDSDIKPASSPATLASRSSQPAGRSVVILNLRTQPLVRRGALSTALPARVQYERGFDPCFNVKRYRQTRRDGPACVVSHRAIPNCGDDQKRVGERFSDFSELSATLDGFTLLPPPLLICVIACDAFLLVGGGEFLVGKRFRPPTFRKSRIELDGRES